MHSKSTPSPTRPPPPPNLSRICVSEVSVILVVLLVESAESVVSVVLVVQVVSVVTRHYLCEMFYVVLYNTLWQYQSMISTNLIQKYNKQSYRHSHIFTLLSSSELLHRGIQLSFTCTSRTEGSNIRSLMRSSNLLTWLRGTQKH